MKKIYLIIMLTVMTLSLQAQFTSSTIKSIQEVPVDSLMKVDSAGYVVNAIWTKQVSPKNGQKVEITALVNIPPMEITFNSQGKTLVISDTGAAASQPWTSIFCNYAGWLGGFDANGYTSVKRGDIIVVKGTVNEFPTGATNSLTQVALDTNEAVIILSSNNPVPAPPLFNMTKFNTGANPGGKINFLDGEPWESKEVMFTNVTITAVVNATRGTWAFSDAVGNTLSMYDWSTHFTLATRTPPRDPNYVVPPVGTKIDTIRGYVGTVSGGEASRGYRISPIFPSDVKYGAILPGVTTHRRNPVIVTKDSTPSISVKAFKQTGSFFNLSTVKLVYRVNNGAWIESTMVAAQAGVDSIYAAKIPKLSTGDYVYYFIKATDANAQTTMLANTANLAQFDTSKGTFFYKVLDRTAQPVLSIRDVQYTPFVNGRTPYLGAIDSVGGIITADTASIFKAALSFGGTNVYYMQSGNQPFSGVWVVGPDSIMAKVTNGDSVIVRGSIQEFNDVTEIFNISSVRIVSKANALPAPVVLKTERFGPSASNGNLNAEPYEGMLVRFDSVRVTSIDPVFQDVYQYEITNSSAPILVARDGRNTYTNDTASTATGIKIKVGNKFQSITGILYYNNNRYKLVPRTNTDFGTLTGVAVTQTEIVPGTFSLEQNYPNPFNPSTTIQYGIPQGGLVTLKVYNVIGQEVATLINQQQNAGIYSVNFDASRLSSGMYLYRITSGNFTQVKRMMLIK
jgi:hypothetical protein